MNQGKLKFTFSQGKAFYRALESLAAVDVGKLPSPTAFCMLLSDFTGMEKADTFRMVMIQMGAAALAAKKVLLASREGRLMAQNVLATILHDLYNSDKDKLPTPELIRGFMVFIPEPMLQEQVKLHNAISRMYLALRGEPYVEQEEPEKEGLPEQASARNTGGSQEPHTFIGKVGEA